MEKNKLDLTAIVPVCIDSQDRVENVLAITKYMHEQLYIDHIILVETGDTPKLLHMIHHFVPKDVLRYIFVQTYNDEPWSRSITFNTALHYVKTPIVAVWDADMIIPLVPLKISCDKICKNEIDVVIPYSNAYSVKRSILNYVMSGEVNFNKILSDKNNILKKMEVTAGGCIILATSIAKHIKGINERFFVWGGEDDEFFLRLIKLGFRICKFSNSPMMHIQHVRTKNCKPNPKYYGSNIMEKNKSISMNKADLCGYYGITEKVCDYVKQEKPRPGETVTKRDAPVTIPDPQY